MQPVGGHPPVTPMHDQMSQFVRERGDQLGRVLLQETHIELDEILVENRPSQRGLKALIVDDRDALVQFTALPRPAAAARDRHKQWPRRQGLIRRPQIVYGECSRSHKPAR